MFDLNSPSAADLHNQPRELILRDHKGAKLGDPDNPATFLVVGRYSDAYQNAQRSLMVQVARDARRGIDSEKSVADKIRVRDSGLDILLECVVGWSNINESGAPATFSSAGVRKILTGYPFVRDQVELFVHQDKNFTSVELTSSSNGQGSNSTSTTTTPAPLEPSARPI